MLFLSKISFRNIGSITNALGVLSPPLEDIIQEKLSLELPSDIIQKGITGYCLHSDNRSLDLKGEEGRKSYAVKRSKIDAFIILKAEEAGPEVIQNKVTAVELVFK